MDKVKEVVHKVTHPGESKHTDTTHTGTHTTGTHTTGTHTGHGAGVTGTSGTAGPHSSNVANKADPRVDSDLDGSRNAGAAQYGAGAHHNTGTTGTGLTGQHDTAGPHSSNLANKADPRVDSDLDGSRNAGASQYGTGAQHTGTTGTGFTGSNTAGTLGTHGSSTTGPHSSNLANKLDPRVDSDQDGSRNAGAAQYGAGAHQTHGTTGSGLTGSHGTTTGGYGSTNAGPHDSNLLNKADPRVDSDRDGSRNAGASQYGPGSHNTYGTTGSGLTGSHGATGGYGSTNAGPHDSNMLNKADPRVDSDRDGSRNAGASQYGPGSHNTYDTTGTGLTGSHGNTSSGLTGNHGAHTGHVGGVGSGPAPNTAGPHKSDMLNKVDPRVDSDRDGSKTVGQAPAPQY